jgi:hypothetical protein
VPSDFTCRHNVNAFKTRNGLQLVITSNLWYRDLEIFMYEFEYHKKSLMIPTGNQKS